MTIKAIRGATLTFSADPFINDPASAIHYNEDSLIVIEDGKISQMSDAATLLSTLPDAVEITHYRDSLIIPGFIDSHIHYPQTEIIASHGEQLLDWLNNYTFVAEQNFSDKDHADAIATFFLEEQIRHGVTSSAVFCTSFPQSVDALFEAASRYNMRMMAGKVCMDRNAPEGLLDTAERAYDESKVLIEKWHNKDRFEYIITPRFAPTSTEAQLEALQTLANENPEMLIQSHISENRDEIEWVKSLFPSAKDYTDVYDRYDLLRNRAIYGHGIHLTERELQRFHESGGALSHCPTSNFFLGSGYLSIKNAKDPQRSVKVGLGTDIGAGTSFSMLQTMNEAYKASQLNSQPINALEAFYLATRGSAEALGIENKVGSLQVGMEADIAVIDLHSTPLIKKRMEFAESMEEMLFVQMILGDDRAIAATYINGVEQKQTQL